MNNKHERSKGVQKKKKLSRIICCCVMLLSLTGLFSILYLSQKLNSITREYSELIETESSTSDTLHTMETQLFRHQSYLLEHAVSSSPEEKEKLENQASELKTSMSKLLIALKAELKDTKFDIRYNSLSSNIYSYISDSEDAFEMSRNGNSEEIKSFMEDTMVENINSVNSDLEDFQFLMNEDLNSTKTALEINTQSIYLQALILAIILMVCGIAGLTISIRISKEIINIDPLTMIPNFDYFTDFCSRKKMQKKFNEYALMSINIKGFQYFNQQHGTSFGDAILSQYADYLKNAIKHDESVARVNGDTFVVIIKKDRVSVLADYLSELSLNIHEKNGTMKTVVKSRCGIYDNELGVPFEEAYENSQTALKEAKNLSNSDCVWYTSRMTESRQEAKETVAKFNSAVKNEEFVVYYQPKVNMTNNRLCGSEALVRWIKDGKMIPPFKFIPVLEEEGYITKLDFYVFEHVCRDIARWTEAGIQPVRTSSNFSKLHLKNKRFAEDILDIIERYNVDKKYIEIELTESSGYEDFDAMTDFVNRMKSEKIHTAIDDFGTGYSSLSMLKDLDIDVVKLDKSFLSGAEDEAHKKMIENVVKMINDLHRNVICEGVETEQQAGFLKSVECFLAQGYLYDKPLPHDEFEERLVNPVYDLKKN